MLRVFLELPKTLKKAMTHEKLSFFPSETELAKDICEALSIIEMCSRNLCMSDGTLSDADKIWNELKELANFGDDSRY